MSTVLDDPAGAGAAAVVGVAAIAVQIEPFILGVPSSVLFTAAAGALFGLAYTDPERWSRLFRASTGSRIHDAAGTLTRALAFAFTLAGNAVASSWAISALPHFPGLQWMHPIPPEPLAGLVAFSSQHVIPRALAAISRWLERK